MKVQSLSLAALALTGVLSASQTLLAQQEPPPPGYGERHDDRDRDRHDNRDRHDDRDRDWNAPRGYNDYYQENGNANMVAREGYAAGFNQGESDFRQHHSFRPTKVDAYKHVPESPQGFNRDDFKRAYREAFERGYSKGYGR